MGPNVPLESPSDPYIAVPAYIDKDYLSAAAMQRRYGRQLPAAPAALRARPDLDDDVFGPLGDRATAAAEGGGEFSLDDNFARTYYNLAKHKSIAEAVGVNIREQLRKARLGRGHIVDANKLAIDQVNVRVRGGGERCGDARLTSLPASFSYVNVCFRSGRMRPPTAAA